jgi:xylulokinase
MLLGLDIGTSSVKALLLAEDGSACGEGAASYAVRAPQRGWAETSPEDWWNAAAQAARAAIGWRGAEVTGLGLSGQMHGVVLAAGDGRSLRPAVLWADSRSVEQLSQYHGLDEHSRRRLANPPAAGMAGPSLLWLRDHESDNYLSARWALQPKDWLRLRLTGEAASEPSDASATLLYDLKSDGWANDLLDNLGLRTELLPPLVTSGEVAGTLTVEAARHFGLRPELPVAAGAADTAAAMLGGDLLEPGTLQLTVGTGGQIVTPRNRFAPDPHGHTHLYRTSLPRDSEGPFYAMAAIQNAGLALEWARKVLGASWEDVYEEAFTIPPGADGVVFLPYLSGERTPHFDPGVRGAWTGLGLGHTRGHLLRAALEGVAFALREGLEALETAGATVEDLRLAGGGTLKEQWRRLLADVLGRQLRTLPASIAGTASARGAALLAGMAVGIYRDAADTQILIQDRDSSVVEPENSDAYEAYYVRYLDLYPRLRRRDHARS